MPVFIYSETVEKSTNEEKRQSAWQRPNIYPSLRQRQYVAQRRIAGSEAIRSVSYETSSNTPIIRLSIA